MKRKVGAIFFIVLILTGSFFFPFRTVHGEDKCKDIKVIFADGSGAKIDGTNNDYLDFKEAVSEVLERTELSFDFYELGSEKQGIFQYPAVSIGVESLEAFLTTMGAILSAGKSYRYGESFEQGRMELIVYMSLVARDCPNTKFILGGFSQGAGVLSMGLPSLKEFYDKIIYVATFGDAKLYLPEGSGTVPPACQGEYFSEYREYVPDCETYMGILSGQIPYQPEGLRGKLGVWCNHYDMICTGRINWSNLNESMDPHGSYGNSRLKDRLYYDAGEVIYEKVLESFGIAEPEIESQRKVHNLAILIDTTGSMRNLINKYREEALRLSKIALGTNGKVAIYEYRDLEEDGFSPVLHCDFETCTLEKINEILDSLVTEGGGDDPESLLSASLQAMNELKWEQGAVKSIVALTDAGYHKTEIVGGKQIGIEEVKLRSLEIDPINFYTITPEGIQSEYIELTTETGGKSFSSTGELNFSTDYILSRPDVKLRHEKYFGQTGQELFFDASRTKAETEIEKFEWDLDFDGVFETETKEPFVSRAYSEPVSGFLQVKAIDKNGLSGTMSAKVQVLPHEEKVVPELFVERFEKNEEENSLKIEFETGGERTLVYVNEVLIGVTNKNEVLITDLDFSIENRISLVPYSGEVGFGGKAGYLTLYSDSTEESQKDEEKEDDHPREENGEKETATEVEKEDSPDETEFENIAETNLREGFETITEADFRGESGAELDTDNKKRVFYPKNPDCGILKR